MYRRSTPLAWKNLTASKKQMALACGGIGFAVVLMVVQTGFRNALLDSTVQIIELFDADLYLLSRARNTLASEERLDRSVLQRAAAVASGEAVERRHLVVPSICHVPKPSAGTRPPGISMKSMVCERERG